MVVVGDVSLSSAGGCKIRLKLISNAIGSFCPCGPILGLGEADSDSRGLWSAGILAQDHSLVARTAERGFVERVSWLGSSNLVISPNPLGFPSSRERRGKYSHVRS